MAMRREWRSSWAPGELALADMAGSGASGPGWRSDSTLDPHKRPACATAPHKLVRLEVTSLQPQAGYAALESYRKNRSVSRGLKIALRWCTVPIACADDACAGLWLYL